MYLCTYSDTTDTKQIQVSMNAQTERRKSTGDLFIIVLIYIYICTRNEGATQRKNKVYNAILSSHISTLFSTSRRKVNIDTLNS